MPPRHAYWTIIVGNLPTAFRAAQREDLLPVFERLRRTHPDAVLRWFARGRLWDSPEAARQRPPRGPSPGGDARARDWRPGGSHRDPRDRFRREQQARWRALRERTHAKRTSGGRPAPKPEPRPADPNRPPRPGQEPPPVPPRPEEIVVPGGPPERGVPRRGEKRREKHGDRSRQKKAPPRRGGPKRR